MKILQVNKFFYLHRGAERYYLNLIKLLEEHGHKVIPFAMASIKNLPSEYQDFFSKNIDLKIPSYSWRSLCKIKDIIYNKDAQHDVAELITRTHPEIVHIHNIYHQLSPSILPVFKYFKLPVVMTVHDFELLCPNYSLFTQGKSCERCKESKYYNAILHRCLKDSFGASAVACLEHYIHHYRRYYQKNVDLFIAPSIFVRNKLVEWGWPAARIVVIPHFIKLDKKAPLLKPKNYMLYFGSLERGKGLKAVIEMLHKEKFDIELHVAGDGSRRNDLKRLVDKYNLHLQVEFLGQLKDEALKEQIRGCKLVIMPSLQYETFGLTVLEAFAQSKPVLVSSQGALPELVDGTNGRIFNPYQPKSLAINLRAMLENLDLAAMGQAGYQLARDKYNQDVHYQAIMEVYSKLGG